LIAPLTAGAALARAVAPHVVLPTSAAVKALPAASSAARVQPYGWPLKPFDRPHLVRGSFGDPRFGAVQRNFHFGIDLPAPDWTPVYAVAPGTVYREPDRVDVLSGVRARASIQGFAYWHIVPAVAEHAYVRTHDLLGYVSPMWHHLHFAEVHDGRWANPLRAGALTPRAAGTVPQIRAVTVAPDTAADGDFPLADSGHVDVVVDAWAVPTAPPPPPWQDAHFAPALIRWRLLADGAPVSHWRRAVDFRDFIPPNTLYPDVYAEGTSPNEPNRAGDYLFYLARDWSLAGIAPGRYVVQVEAFGSRGAGATATAPLDVPATDVRQPAVPA
jgi:hypothetical protein